MPQGSILGLLLFFLYVDDMAYCSRILQVVLFSDDTNTCLTHNDVNLRFDIVNIELVALSNWFKVNKLSLNISKTNFMIFTNSDTFKSMCRKRNVIIDGITKGRVEKCKFLGVIIDDRMSWKPQYPFNNKHCCTEPRCYEAYQV